jgi:hypothetical protein
MAPSGTPEQFTQNCQTSSPLRRHLVPKHLRPNDTIVVGVGRLMIKNGADLSLSSRVWDNSHLRPFNAIDVALRRKDTRMANLLRRAGAPAGIYRRPSSRR